MPINLAISPKRVERAVCMSGAKTNTAAVTLALRELIARREQARLIELVATLDWDHDFGHASRRVPLRVWS